MAYDQCRETENDYVYAKIWLISHREKKEIRWWGEMVLISDGGRNVKVVGNLKAREIAHGVKYASRKPM